MLDHPFLSFNSGRPVQLSEYLGPLLSSAQALETSLFLQASAATFAQLMRLPKELLSIEPKSPLVTPAAANDVIFTLFEHHMDDYLSEETDFAKESLESICQNWNSTNNPATRNAQVFVGAAGENAALAKRNFVSSFTKALIAPVTIVPQAVGAVTVGAFNAVASLGQFTTASSSGELAPISMGADQLQSQAADVPDGEIDLHNMQQLLSLDLALQLIQAALESLKRAQSFAVYPPDQPCGIKVRCCIEEIFMSLLQTLTEHHILPAFRE